MKYRELQQPKSIKFYSMKGCPHCTNALPAFNKAATMTNIPAAVVSNTTANGRYEIENASISSFPTIIGTSRGKRYEYEGDRSVQSFLDFANFLK